MFIHFSILMLISKKKGTKFNQKYYDFFFHNIEYNLRELGFGDVSVTSCLALVKLALVPPHLAPRACASFGCS